MEKVCNTVTENKCHYIEDEKCETNYLLEYSENCNDNYLEDETCTTYYEEECKDITEPVCTTVYDTIEDNVCNTVNDEICNTDYEEQCKAEVIEDKSCTSSCKTVYDIVRKSKLRINMFLFIVLSKAGSEA